MSDVDLKISRSIDALAVQEDGQAVYQVDLGRWSNLEHGASAVRRAVFIEEQGIPECEEWDADDADAVHALVINPAGLPVATGRLIHVGQPHGHAKIGRMAVVRSSRGLGLGRMVLTALLAKARELQITDVSLHAQTSAQLFYAQMGFEPYGPVFDEVDIPHQGMRLRL